MWKQCVTKGTLQRELLGKAEERQNKGRKKVEPFVATTKRLELHTQEVKDIQCVKIRENDYLFPPLPFLFVLSFLPSTSSSPSTIIPLPLPFTALLFLLFCRFLYLLNSSFARCTDDHF